MRVKTATLTNCGGKAVNDDAVSVMQKKGIYVFVGDGLGGYAGGRQASQAAAAALMEAAKQRSLLPEEEMRKAAAEADQAVFRVQKESGGSMKTTLAFLVIENGWARWMHVGDTRVYHFRRGKLAAQTMDHSVSQMAVLMGEISVSQIRFHEDRNRVLRALGADNAKPDVSEKVKLTSGDAFLLCTDGFWEYVDEREMELLLQSAKDPLDWLKKMETLLRNRIPADTDNYTAAAVIC